MKVCSNRTCTREAPDEFKLCNGCRANQRVNTKNYAERHPDRIKAQNKAITERYRNDPEFRNKRLESAARWKERTRTARKEYQTRYRLGVEFNFQEMWDAQEGRCAICDVEMKLEGRTRLSVQVDHDHDTGLIRAMLCGPCNNGLGCFRDDVDRMAKAIEYINKHKATVTT